jgi:hypothetical protein
MSIDRLRLLLDLNLRGLEWILTAAGIKDERLRHDVAYEIGRSGLASWLAGVDEPIAQRLAFCVSQPIPHNVVALSGRPGEIHETGEILMRAFDGNEPLEMRVAWDVNLVSLSGLEALFEFLGKAKFPTFLRCLEKVNRGDSSVPIYEGDVIQAGTRNAWDRLKTVLAMSCGNDCVYRELIWSDSHGFFSGDRKLNVDMENGYNRHVFTMQDGWKIIGNIHLSRRFLLPPVCEGEAGKA